MQSEQVLKYLKQGIDDLCEAGHFEGGQPFRRTQRQALEAYKNYLSQPGLDIQQRLKGFFEIPTGVGKTAVFIGIIAAAHQAADREGETMRTTIVVPTIQLLDQTKKAIEGDEEQDKIGFAPSFNGKIGLFGGGRKSRSKPITIMTYDAWYDLSQAGDIGSHNIDILISDEAHRGTSERRIENITGIFNEHTAQIAFTATAHFDKVKSVEASHENEVFYKSVKDAVQERELASYIASQRVVIRVEPTDFMATDAYKGLPVEEKIKIRRQLRQQAWNQYVLDIYKNGTDRMTGDLLSDNQAGFFVEGITQANALEQSLNSDTELLKKARAKGCETVALAIHSGLSKKERERRFDAYLSGKCLAVVGDEQFKEGFDHPPMKTLFDSMHESVVDKAQIIGRGARKWWNADKERYEGLTVVDTAIYIGSEDEEQDKALRSNALRRAVSVKNVLEEIPLLSPGTKMPSTNQSRSSSSGTGDLFEDDPNIEYYADLDDVYQLEAEVEDIRAGFVLTMEDVIDTIDAYRAENGNQNPTNKKGAIVHGPLKDKIHWSGLDAALTKGANGLIEDTYWQELNDKLGDGNLTLFTLLIELRYKDLPPIVTMADVIATIDAFRAENGNQNPTQNSGEITQEPFANKFAWRNLNDFLMYGSHGLSDDPQWQELNDKSGDGNLTLATLLVELGYKDPTTKLTMADVIATIDAFRTENGNQNPTTTSGDISQSPLANKFTWGAINQSLSKGSHGLSYDPYWQELNEKIGDGNLTLATLLVELGYKDPTTKLTMADVIATIDAFRTENGNQNPTTTSGDISQHPLAGRLAWSGLNSALGNGSNGLSDDPYWQELSEKIGDGNLTLATLLVELGYKDPTTKLTMADVIATIDAFRTENNNQNPAGHHGDITQSPLAGKLTWGSLSQALQKGINGLSDDPYWQELNEKIGDGNLTLPALLIELGYKERPVKLTMADVVTTIDAFRAENKGNNPTQTAENITQEPLAGKFTWRGLSKALENGSHGLSEDPSWQEMNTRIGDQKLSLPNLLIELGYKKKSVKLTMADVIATIDAFRAENDNQNPTQRSGNITQPPLAGQITWSALNQSLQKGARGLSDDPYWQEISTRVQPSKLTLSKLIEELGYKGIAPSRPSGFDQGPT